MGAINSLSSSINSIKEQAKRIKDSSFLNGLNEDTIGPLMTKVLSIIEEIIDSDFADLSNSSKVEIYNEIAYQLINWRPKSGSDKASTINYLRFICGLEYCFGDSLRVNSLRTLENIVIAAKLDIASEVKELLTILNEITMEPSESSDINITVEHMDSFFTKLEKLRTVSAGGNASLSNVKTISQQIDEVISSMYANANVKDSIDNDSVITKAKQGIQKTLNKINSLNDYVNLANQADNFYDGKPLAFITFYLAEMMAAMLNSNANSVYTRQAIIIVSLKVIKKIIEYATDKAVMLSEKKGDCLYLAPIEEGMLRIKSLYFNSLSKPDSNAIEGLKSELESIQDCLVGETSVCNLPYWYSLAMSSIGNSALDRFYIAGLSGNWKAYAVIDEGNSEFDSDAINLIATLNIPAYRKLGAIKTIASKTMSIESKFNELVGNTAKSSEGMTNAMEFSAALVEADTEAIFTVELKDPLSLVYKELWDCTGANISKWSASLSSLLKVAPDEETATVLASDHIAKVIAVLNKHNSSKFYGVLDEAISDYKGLVNRYWKTESSVTMINKLLRFFKESVIFINTVKERYRML